MWRRTMRQFTRSELRRVGNPVNKGNHQHSRKHMKFMKTTLISTGIGAAALLLMAPWANSQPPGGAAGASGGRGGGRGQAQPMDYNDNTGFQSLFDGKTLNGWE